jgi:hypothetical protein
MVIMICIFDISECLRENLQPLQQYKCKPFNLSNDNQTQLIRHRDDRHGPQVMCSYQHTQPFVVSHKRTTPSKCTQFSGI